MVATSRRLARSDRALKKLRGVKKGTGIKLTKAIHVLNIFATVPVTVNGFLVSIDKNFIAFRHKKTNASKKTRVTTFTRNKVIELFGNVGEASQITVWKRHQISSLRGYAKLDHKLGTVTITDLVTEEPTVVFLSDAVDIELFADEEEKAQRPPRKSKRASKSVDEDDEEEEDDDAEDDDSSEEEDFEEDDEDEESEEDEDDSEEDEEDL